MFDSSNFLSKSEITFDPSSFHTQSKARCTLRSCSVKPLPGSFYILASCLLSTHSRNSIFPAFASASSPSLSSSSLNLRTSTTFNTMSDPSQVQPANTADLIKSSWFHERGPLWPGQAFTLQIENILHHKRSLYQDVLVFDSTNYGKVLVLDGVIQCTERDEFSYQEMIAHLPLYAHPNPKKVLVIGGGDGGVLREIARHECVEEIVICELDKDVIEVSKKYLPFMAKGFDDPRVKVHIMDGAKFMDENQSSFDVIITDSSDPVGPASVLFETPFYNAMYKSLRPGGIICTQGECVWLHVDLIRPLIKAITGMFDTVEYGYCTIPSYPSGQIGFIVATKGGEGGVEKGKGCKSPVRTPDEKVQKELRYYTPQIHNAAFVLPAFAERAIFGGEKE